VNEKLCQLLDLQNQRVAGNQLKALSLATDLLAGATEPATPVPTNLFDNLTDNQRRLALVLIATGFLTTLQP
jgi:hypothetical protein